MAGKSYYFMKAGLSDGRDNKYVNRVSSLLVCSTLLAAPGAYAFARLSPEAAGAFDRYVEQAEARMGRDRTPLRFLYADEQPEVKTRLRSGELIIEPASALDRGPAPRIPGGMLQDWVGMMFIPGATIERVKAVLEDNDNYKNFYKPEVIESKKLDGTGDESDVFMRLYEKHILTVVLNTTYHTQYGMLDASRMYVTSRSTRIAEVKNPNESYTEELPVGNDTGFLWRLNSYWRFEAADGGVYAECEAISLSRDVPLGLGWMLKGFLERFPKESMLNTLRGTRAAVEARRVSSAAPQR
jgi:hypothetical protein